MNDATFSASFLWLTPVVQPMLTISKLPATDLCFLMNAAISLKSEGVGNPSGSLSGSTPSHRAALLKGRCLGQDPPTIWESWGAAWASGERLTVQHYSVFLES